MLKLGIPLLAGLVVLAVLIEAGNSKPGPISTGLTSLGVEKRRKRVLLSKNRTVALQVIFGDTAPVHPLAQAFVPNELHNANGLINGLILLLVPVQFGLVDQHQISPFDAWFQRMNKATFSQAFCYLFFMLSPKTVPFPQLEC